MRSVHTPRDRASAAVILLTVLLLASGCSRLVRSSEPISVADPNNLFHFKIPGDWQANTDQGFIAVYADRELPKAGERPTALSILVYSSRTASNTPVPEMLERLIEARAGTRGWRRLSLGRPRTAALGGRPAYTVDALAVDADGIDFETRYILARTSGAEVFVVAIAPRGESISSYDEELRRIAEQWYWLIPDDTKARPATMTPNQEP